MQFNNKHIIWIGLLCAIWILPSCKKLVQVGPPLSSLSSANVYTTDATAASVLTGIYTNLSLGNSNGAGISGLTSMSLLPALSADELTLFDPTNPTYSGYYKNMLSSSTASLTIDYWKTIYPIIYIVNSAIVGMTNNSALTPAVQQQLMGEAKFMRAFCYFYLVNLYGPVPLATGTDYTVNASLPRASTSEVWQQITQDLKDAQGLLSINYLDATLLSTTTQRVRPTKWAAAALLARAYLYTNDWAGAKAEADSVIGNTTLYTLDSLNAVFLAGSTEAIWQLQAVGIGANSNTGEGALFVLPASGPNTTNYPVSLSGSVVNSFEPNDERRINWIDSVVVGSSTYYYSYKYKIGLVDAPVQEYSMVLRLGEQFLIRAEAEAELNDLTDATGDLNMIRNRAGLPNISGAIGGSQTSLLAAIQHERQVELFTEWGHRWLDLKRTGTVDAVLGAPGNICQEKGGTWNTDWQWYPIALSELLSDPALLQNTGY